MCFRCLRSRQTNYWIIFFPVWKLGCRDLKKPHRGDCGWECLFMKAGRLTPSTALLFLTCLDVLFYSLFFCIYMNKNSVFLPYLSLTSWNSFTVLESLLFSIFITRTHARTPTHTWCGLPIQTAEGSQYIVSKITISVGLYENVGKGQATMMCTHRNTRAFCMIMFVKIKVRVFLVAWQQN